MDFDANGDLYVGVVGAYDNPYNPYRDLLDTVFRISPDGTVHVVARQFFSPNVFFDIVGLTFGPDGSLYISDTWVPRDILKVDLATNTSIKFATKIFATDLLFDTQGNLLVAGLVEGQDYYKVWSFNQQGTRTVYSDRVPTPVAITWSPDGLLYAVSASAKAIYTVDPVTKEATPFATGFYFPRDLEFDSQGNLYVSEPCLGDLTPRLYPEPPQCFGQIIKISPVANQLPVADAGPDQTVQCASPEGAGATLDGSGSFDPDGDPLTFTWTVVFPDGTTFTTTGQFLSLVFPVGTSTATLVVNDGLADSAPDTVTITVKSAAEGITDLISLVQSLGLEPEGIENSLLAKLEAANGSIDAGANNTAANQLEAFINQVEAQAGKKLTEEQAALLLAAAQTIISCLGF